MEASSILHEIFYLVCVRRCSLWSEQGIWGQMSWDHIWGTCLCLCSCSPAVKGKLNTKMFGEVFLGVGEQHFAVGHCALGSRGVLFFCGQASDEYVLLPRSESVGGLVECQEAHLKSRKTIHLIPGCASESNRLVKAAFNLLIMDRDKPVGEDAKGTAGHS